MGTFRGVGVPELSLGPTWPSGHGFPSGPSCLEICQLPNGAVSVYMRKALLGLFGGFPFASLNLFGKVLRVTRACDSDIVGEPLAAWLCL